MYCKLFTSLYQGTLRGKSDEILVFTNLLAHADRFGVSDIHPKSIAEEVGLPLKRVQTALSYLEDIDPESRSPENEGRRIVRMDEHRAWGWTITNYIKYREIKNEDDRREQNRLAQQKWRDKKKGKSATVSESNHNNPESAYAEVEVEEKSKETSVPDAIEFGSDVELLPLIDEYTFAQFLNDEDMHYIQTYRPDLWDDLNALGWKTKDKKTGRMVPIKDWMKYLKGLEEHLEKVHPSNN